MLDFNNFTLERAGVAQPYITNFTDSFRAGEVVILAGPSGVGKSTLIRYLAGLRDPGINNGTVQQFGPGVRVGLQFQQGALFDDFTVPENLDFASTHAAPAGPAELTRQGAWDVANATLRQREVSQLSGGQQRLVALERTRRSLAQVLLFDEPTVGLDPGNAVVVVNAIRSEAAQGRLVIVITHELHYFDPLAIPIPPGVVQRVFLLQPGSLTRITAAFPIQAAIAALQAPVPSPPPLAGSPSFAGKVAAALSPIRMLKRFDNAGGWFWPWLPLFTLLIRPMGDGLLSFARGIIGLRASRLSWWLAYFGRVTTRSWFSLSAVTYFGIMGAMFGFTLWFAVLRFFPEKGYSLPIVFDRLSAVYSMGLYKVVIPLFVSILFAARSGMAVASDLGNRVLGRQAEAMHVLGARSDSYLSLPVICAFIPGLLILQELTYLASMGGSALAYMIVEPDILVAGPVEFAGRELSEYFTHRHPFSLTWLKLVVTAIIVSAYVAGFGLREKRGGQDVSADSIRAVLLSTVAAIAIAFIFVLVEF